MVILFRFAPRCRRRNPALCDHFGRRIVKASLKLLSEVRDLQVVDRDGRNCGICDDIEFEAGARGTIEVRALLVGPGAMHYRLPNWAARSFRLIWGERVVRVSWSDIDTVGSHIVLRKSAKAYGLHLLDDRLSQYPSKVPSL
jgi:sporulation protein YlmC with PRC-barrel domain